MRFLLLLFITVTTTGCFSRFVMTDKELAAYYKNRPLPRFAVIKNDSLQLYCATAGADTLPPLLVVHGAPGAWYGSRNLLEDSLLLLHYQVIIADRPGYNKTRFKKKRKAVSSIALQSQLLVQALQLNHSGNKRGIVMGSSYGGPIAAKMAIDYADRFNHVILLAPALDPDKEKFWWFHPFIKGGPIKWMLPRNLRNATTEKFTHTKELRLLAPQLQQLNVPITIVQGGKDDIVDPANFDFAKKILKDKPAYFIFLPDANHFIRWQQPRLVKQLLLQEPGASGY